MAELVSFMSDSISVQYGQFLFIDIDGATDLDADSPWDVNSNEAWLETTVNGGRITTDYSDHKTEVRFELWDGVPTTESDEVLELEFTATSGKLRLVELVSYSEHPIFDLGRDKSTWNLRALRRFLRTHEEIDWETEGFPSGLEHYTLQFWPDN
ncbi:hypothetical protein OIE66_07125 [Nonomuraea sp. NBC_01738]|uniref:hypothetical protein n=1 Tax=Nonomuraea sp. NBC_01738 TaxID=2976003 RepID=UPI002E1098DC|nr:hypothetical protein OIE66_07125 [Nonomuraea sp. NBC_01738]